MDSVFLIITICFVLYYMFKRRSGGRPNSDLRSNMTDTQRNWHEYKQQTDDKVITNGQIFAYIDRHKRPFRISEWLVSTVDRRLLFDYIKNMMIVLFISISIPWIFATPLFPESILICVIMIDFFMYHKQLVFEVTEWNPEFYEKFLKR